ncbi:MAG TPA: hypothetical protein VGL53_25810 [Bryobacteraceae bacterium]
MERISRRELLVAAGAVSVAASAATPKQETPSFSASASREDDLKTAREMMANDAEQLKKVELPMAAEPAFSFKA